MDSCSIHHIQEVKSIYVLQSVGILVIFLPPYSPNYNQAEELFSYVKYYLKENDELLQVISKPLDVLRRAFDSVTRAHSIGWISDLWLLMFVTLLFLLTTWQCIHAIMHIHVHVNVFKGSC